MEIKNIVEIINKELVKLDDLGSIELEARLGIYDIDNSKFDSNIGSSNFEKINEMLDTFKGWISNETISSSIYSKGNMRLILTPNGTKSVIDKIKIKSFTFILDDLPLDMRVTISRETPLPISKFPRGLKSLHVRHKERISREYQNASFDLTSVKVPTGKDIEQTFEFEVEHKGHFKNSEEAIFQIIYKILDANYMLDGFQRNHGMVLPLELLNAKMVNNQTS